MDIGVDRLGMTRDSAEDFDHPVESLFLSRQTI